MKKILIVCSVALLLAVNAWADTVTFKSRKKVEGNIKSITNDSVTVDLYGVTEMTYDLADIQEINGQAIELKPAATSPAQAAPEVAPPAETVETAPVINEAALAVAPPVGENPKIKLSDKETKAFMPVIMAFLGIIIIIFLILYIYSAICLQIIANKTDTANGWLAWIPIANLFLMCNIGKAKYLWLLLIFASFVPIVGGILGPLCNLFLFGYLWYIIALARGKQGWIGAISVIPVVGLVTIGYLAFSKKEGAAPLPNIGDGQPAKLLGTAPTYKPPLE